MRALLTSVGLGVKSKVTSTRHPQTHPVASRGKLGHPICGISIHRRTQRGPVGVTAMRMLCLYTRKSKILARWEVKLHQARGLHKPDAPRD